MNSAKINDNEKELMSLRAELLRRRNLINKDKKRASYPLPESLDDQAVANENDEVIDKLDILDSIELQQINVALKKIEKGIFGICSTCGNQIANKRLKALPCAANCIECESSEITRGFDS